MMLFLGIDMGTSYFKAGLFNEKGALVGLGRVAVPKTSAAGVSELTVWDFWKILNNCIQQALQQARATLKEVCAISYSSQANTFILMDGKEEPLTPLILWTDERAPVDATLREFSQQEEWLQTTGIGIEFSAGFCINKCKWLQQHDPELWNRVNSILTLPDYFTFCLTGEKIVDTSTASLLGLLDIDKQCWWSAGLNNVGIEKRMLSIIAGIGEGIYSIRSDNPLQLFTGTHLVIGGLDHHMAAIGVGIGSKVKLSESTGTVIAAVLYSSNDERLKNVCMAPGITTGTYFKMSFDRNGAEALEWYQQTFAPEFTIEELLEMAADITLETSTLNALPCVHWYPNKDGFLNQNEKYHHGHYVRAIMESTAESLKQLIEKVDIHKESDAVFSTGGGAKSVLWGEIKEAIVHRKFYRNKNSEAACRGAAMTAAAGNSYFDSIFQAQEYWLQ